MNKKVIKNESVTRKMSHLLQAGLVVNQSTVDYYYPESKSNVEKIVDLHIKSYAPEVYKFIRKRKDKSRGKGYEYWYDFRAERKANRVNAPTNVPYQNAPVNKDVFKVKEDVLEKIISGLAEQSEAFGLLCFAFAGDNSKTNFAKLVTSTLGIRDALVALKNQNIK